ncbi:hypothetical protein NIES2104_23160 [Leptolyngbya sp. NIES-2104]|nr:hypothetical protein NIES2104_23160 [Leptolyngbya sp. NIES-2104]
MLFQNNSFSPVAGISLCESLKADESGNAFIEFQSRCRD